MSCIPKDGCSGKIRRSADIRVLGEPEAMNVGISAGAEEKHKSTWTTSPQKDEGSCPPGYVASAHRLKKMR